jgi:CRISPR-associated protein Cas2
MINIVAVYDIADPRRLRRVARIMEDYGLRVQLSVFEVNLPYRSFCEMRNRVENTILSEEDGVKYFHLCNSCKARAERIGCGIFIEPDADYCVL